MTPGGGIRVGLRMPLGVRVSEVAKLIARSEEAGFSGSGESTITHATDEMCPSPRR